MTQSAQIREALKSGERLTPLDALRRFGCLRLGARIWELKMEGMAIEKDMVEVTTSRGTARVAEYRAVK